MIIALADISAIEGIKEKMTDQKNNLNGASHNVKEFPDKRERDIRIKQKQDAQKKATEKPHEPILKLPKTVKWLSAVLLAFFGVTLFAPTEIANTIFLNLAFQPDLYIAPNGKHWMWLTMPFTHALLHGGWFHIGMNIGMLLAFGSAVEKYIGGKKLMAIFLVTTAVGALTHLAFYWGETGALIGASGGISGLFGALLRVMQEHGQMKPGWRAVMPITLLWIGISVLFAVFATTPGGATIAWTAHVGGFLGGLLLYTPLMKIVK